MPMGTVRMTLKINGVDYVVHPLGVLHGHRSFRLRKRVGGYIAAKYIVGETDTGTQCDCPDFTTRRMSGQYPEGCKHIKALRTFYMVV